MKDRKNLMDLTSAWGKGEMVIKWGEICFKSCAIIQIQRKSTFSLSFFGDMIWQTMLQTPKLFPLHPSYNIPTLFLLSHVSFFSSFFLPSLWLFLHNSNHIPFLVPLQFYIHFSHKFWIIMYIISSWKKEFRISIFVSKKTCYFQSKILNNKSVLNLILSKWSQFHL